MADANDVYAVFRLMSKEDQETLMRVMQDRAKANRSNTPKLTLIYNDATDIAASAASFGDVVRRRQY